MRPKEIADQLERLLPADDFANRSTELVDRWNSADLGVEAIEPILRFMEEHPSIVFGTPGPLVHFAEKFYRQGYEETLLQSISRKPTQHTVWMLNRVINGTKVPATKQLFVAAMVRAKSHPLADPNTMKQIDRFLEISTDTD